MVICSGPDRIAVCLLFEAGPRITRPASCNNKQNVRSGPCGSSWLPVPMYVSERLTPPLICAFVACMPSRYVDVYTVLPHARPCRRAAGMFGLTTAAA